jgi:hypothetical protein
MQLFLISRIQNWESCIDRHYTVAKFNRTLVFTLGATPSVGYEAKAVTHIATDSIYNAETTNLIATASSENRRSLLNINTS